jgi:putative flavoprotein involved in K+ transport
MFVPAVIVGAGHAGLAMSHRLTARSIDHVVVERGEVANSWRTERWESLRLLTPNWHARLPGHRHNGDDPDDFMSVREITRFITGYARTIAAPVQSATIVTGVTALGDGYEITTDRGVWRCAAVVIATGACSVAVVPPIATGLPDGIASVTPQAYRRADDLAEGGVLVVGASATGVQLAEELRRSGREVTLAVGEHVRMPRSYRGRDIFWWTDTAGILDEPYDALDDVVRARHLPSPQLIGTPQRRSIDLNSLQDLGVRIVGRLGRIRDGAAQFSGSLPNACKLADLKMNRLLAALDEWATHAGVDDDVGPPERFEPTHIPAPTPTDIDLERDGIRTVIWATGYRPDHRWIQLPVFDHKGMIRHDGGVVGGAPGMYVLGLNVLRRRGSSFIGGAARDTADLAAHLHQHLDHSVRTMRATLWRPPVNHPIPSALAGPRSPGGRRLPTAPGICC